MMFFSSLTGYLVAGVFLVVTALFLWFVPGTMNIPLGGYASLESLFMLAPWIYLFLVPAVTMRLLAEERRQGTMELLLTHPLTDWQVVGAKYLAGLSLVLLSLLPTLVYFFSVSQLAQPVGNIDHGAIWGSYIGLVLLAAVYAAVGLFTSSLSDNQLVAFLLAVVLCYFFYDGFAALASLQGLGQASVFINNLGIDAHYQSISRGVVDLRDLAYFLGVIALFLALTRLELGSRRWSRPAMLRKDLAQLGAVVALVLAVNVLAQQWYFRLDLTAEKRYTLAPVTKQFLGQNDKQVLVKVYLSGDLNPGFSKLARATRDMLDEFRLASGAALRYEFVDPADSPTAKEELAEYELAAVPVFETQADGRRIQSNVYPYALFNIDDYELPVNLLDNLPGRSGAENLNSSMEALEYKLSDVMRRLLTDEVPAVAFLEGHGELDMLDVYDISEALSYHYQVDRGSLTDDPYILDNYKAVIIAKPQEKFSEREKFVLDQYLMRGGRLLWLVDAVQVTLDSLRSATQTVGLATDVNLTDQLFRYGVRINHELVQDVQAAMIPVNTAGAGEQARLVPVPWMFHPLLNTNREHPVTRNLNVVRGEFVSSIDTVGTPTGLRRDVLLRTSQYARRLPVPVFISLAMVNEEPNRAAFGDPHLPVAVALEGRFPSAFANRPVPPGLQFSGDDLRRESKPTRMIVVSDGDIIRNEVRMRHGSNPQPMPLGFDELGNQQFGNRDFILNAVHYLADEEGWMALRSRSYQLRLLDREKLASELEFWKWLNLLLPLVFLGLLGLVFPLWRKWRYGRPARRA